MSTQESNADYDFCIVFPAENGGFTAKGKGYIFSLKKLGFQMYAYSGVREDKEIFVLLRTPLPKLRAYADIIDFRMRLDSSVIQHLLEKGDNEANIAPVEIKHRPDITPYEPYQHIFAKYSRKVVESLYAREEGQEDPFCDVVRLKLSSLILESRVDGSQNLKIRRYLRSKWLLGCYPLHDKVKKDAIWAEWRQYPRKALPLTLYKDYFGEKNAMYFAFMEHFVQFLAIPAVVGIPLQIAVFATGNYSAPFLPYFSFFIALWAVCMLEVNDACQRENVTNINSIVLVMVVYIQCIQSYNRYLFLSLVCDIFLCDSSGSVKRRAWRWSGAPLTSRARRSTAQVNHVYTYYCR